MMCARICVYRRGRVLSHRAVWQVHVPDGVRLSRAPMPGFRQREAGGAGACARRGVACARAMTWQSFDALWHRDENILLS